MGYLSWLWVVLAVAAKEFPFGQVGATNKHSPGHGAVLGAVGTVYLQHQFREIVGAGAKVIDYALRAHVVDDDDAVLQRLLHLGLQFAGGAYKGVGHLRAGLCVDDQSRAEHLRQYLGGDKALAPAAVTYQHQALALVVAEPRGYLVVLVRPLCTVAHLADQCPHQQLLGVATGGNAQASLVGLFAAAAQGALHLGQPFGAALSVLLLLLLLVAQLLQRPPLFIGYIVYHIVRFVSIFLVPCWQKLNKLEQIKQNYNCVELSHARQFKYT